MPGRDILFRMGEIATWHPSSDERDPLTYAIIGCAIDVHRALGPGLRESAYEDCLNYALRNNGLRVTRQVPLPVEFEGAEIGRAFRPDLIVNGEVVVEIKTVSALLPVHDAQMLTYLRFSGIERGLLLNFNSRRMTSGIKRLILSRPSA
jgi:GxxExxY protein